MKSNLIVFFVIACVMLIIFKTRTDRKDDEEYFKKIDLKMDAVVNENPDCPSASNGFCVLSLKVLTSNIQYYNEKDSNFFILINNDYAYLLLLGCRDINKGDTLKIDVMKKNVYCLNKRKSFQIIMPTNDHFLSYVKNKYGNN